MRVATIILIIASLTSCKKAELDYVKGTVYEFGSGEPVKGATVYLRKDTKENHSGPFVFDSTITDQNGEYRINFYKGRDYYSLSCKCAGYIDLITGGPNVEHNRNACNITIQPYSHVQLRFIKTSNSPNYVTGGFNPFLTLGFFSHRYNPSDTAAFYQPFDVVDDYIYPVHGNQNNVLSWWVQDYWHWDADAYRYEQTFFAPKEDTLHFTISFN